MKKFLLAILPMAVSMNCYGAFSILLDAGQLRANSTTGLLPGSVLVFISAGADGVFETPTNLMAGSYVAGDDVLLSVMTDSASAQPFNTSGGTNETISTFSMTQVTPPTGQPLALMWFPAITYAQWQAGTTPTAGQTFGFYNPIFWGNATANPDGGDPWTVPAPGGLISLDLFTTDTDLGGTQSPNRGFGNNFTVLPIPEPSTYALLAAGATCLCTLRRRRKS